MLNVEKTMIRILISLALSIVATIAHAQTWTQLQWGVNKSSGYPYSICMNISGSWSCIGSVNSGGVFSASPSSMPAFTGGDCTSIAGSVALTCTKTSGVSFGYFATGTDAANLTGTVPAARMPAFTGGDCTSSAGSVALDCTKTGGVPFGYFATGTGASNLTGTVAPARMPAFTGGDCTSSAGSVALDCKSAFTPTVASNTALSALPYAYATSVLRLGYATAGDAPPVFYTRSNSACSLNAGAGDGGSQVPTSDGKCWIANLGDLANLSLWGADKTGAASVDSKLAAAIAAMKVSGGQLEISAGKYLLDGSAQSALSGVKIKCDGAPADETVAETNYGKTGVTFYVTSVSASPFTDAVGSEIEGCTFFWPNQVENSSAPIVYPPLIEPTNSMVDFKFHNNTVVNAYDLIKIGVGATAGVVSIDDNRMFVLNKLFNAQGGIADTIKIRDNFISYAVYENAVLFNGAGTSYLRDFATANATIVAVDNGSASYKSLDGLLLHQNFVFGVRYGVNVVSGQLDVSSIDGNTFDAVQTPFSMSGTSKVPHLSVRSNSVYSYRPGYDATCNPVFDMQSNGANVSNVQFAVNSIMFARGNVFNVNNGTGLKDFTSSGDRIDAWGQCSTTGEYYAYAIADSALDVSISNPTLRAVAAGSNTNTGFSLNSRTANVEGFNVIAANTVVRAISGKIRLRGQALDTVTASLIDATGTPSTVDAKGVRWSIVPTKYGFPAFSAVVNGSQTFTGTKTQASFGTTIFDEGGNYSSGTFTAPSAGFYSCRTQLAYTSGSTAADVWKLSMESSGGTIRVSYKTVYASDGIGTMSISQNMKLAASETVIVYMTRNSGTGNYVVPADAQASWFQCERSD